MGGGIDLGRLRSSSGTALINNLCSDSPPSPYTHPPLSPQTSPEYDILFVDFGNTARVKGAALRPADSALAAVAPQAQAATLAFVRAPALESEWGVDAAQALADLVGDGRRLVATVEAREKLPASGKQWGEQVCWG